MRQGEDRRVMKTLDLDRKIKKLSDSYFTLWQTKKVSLPCVLVVASIIFPNLRRRIETERNRKFT